MRSDGSCDIASSYLVLVKIWRRGYGPVPRGHRIGSSCGTELCVDHPVLVIPMACKYGHPREPGTRCKRCGYTALLRWRAKYPEKARASDRKQKRRQRRRITCQT